MVRPASFRAVCGLPHEDSTSKPDSRGRCRYVGLNRKGRSSISSRSDPKFVLRLQRGFDFKTPGFQKRLGDVLRVLIAAGPLAQTSRAQILVGREFVLAHNLFEFGDGWGNGPNRLRLAPVWISASLGHEKCLSTYGDKTAISLNYLILRGAYRMQLGTRASRGQNWPKDGSAKLIGERRSYRRLSRKSMKISVRIRLRPCQALINKALGSIISPEAPLEIGLDSQMP